VSSLIYIADDEITSRQTIRAFLEKEGFQVECFENGDMLFSAFQQNACELVILDILVPRDDSFMIVAKIRQISNLPIIMLAEEDCEEDYIFGISLGVDAYLIKPFSHAKLIAHVRALLIKAELSKHIPVKEQHSELTYAGITIYPDGLTCHCNDKELELTKTEFQLLKFMIENKNRAISRGELLNEIWGFDHPVETRATDDTIKRLRRKLTIAGSHVLIDTVWGFGFRLGVKEE